MGATPCVSLADIAHVDVGCSPVATSTGRVVLDSSPGVVVGDVVGVCVRCGVGIVGSEAVTGVV